MTEDRKFEIFGAVMFTLLGLLMCGKGGLLMAVAEEFTHAGSRVAMFALGALLLAGGVSLLVVVLIALFEILREED